MRFFILVALGTIGIWGREGGDGEGGINLASRGVARVPRDDEPLLWNNFKHVSLGKDDAVERLLVERVPDPTRGYPREQAAPALSTPKPTAPPQKRQDDGQIQALSSQLRSLSESATQAISSVSSSASSAMSLVSQSIQSVRQSADQAVRSANQNADNANRQLSQTQSSASSAVSAATQRASDDMSRSLSSMSSRISSNLASVQSSASSAISVARVEASSSAANAVNIAASQVQGARADATGVRGDASSGATQAQSNSISTTTLAIIITASVVGTAILTAIAVFSIVRYRRKKRGGREAEVPTIATNDREVQQYERPIAVRETLESAIPRFTPFGGGTGYPMDKFNLPDLSLTPFLKKKTNEETPSTVGFARNSYPSTDGGEVPASNDVYGVSPTSFRLQKENNIKRATSVRIIRVGSTKGKAKASEDQRALLSPTPSIPRVPTPSSFAESTQEPALISPEIQQQFPDPPSPAKPPPAELPPVATRPVQDPEMEEPGLGPMKHTTTMNSQQRLRFRDSSDVESAEPSPASWQASAAPSAMRNTNTASLRAITDGSDLSPSRRPKNAGASFATFPRVRNGPPKGSAAEAILNRNRIGLDGITARAREEAERRRRGLDEGSGDDATRVVENRDGPAPNWPFGNS